MDSPPERDKTFRNWKNCQNYSWNYEPNLQENGNEETQVNSCDWSPNEPLPHHHQYNCKENVVSVSNPKETTPDRENDIWFAKQYLDHDWSRTVFIDEKKVTLVQLPNRKNDVIWAPKGQFIPFVETVKHPFAFNVCAGISVKGRTEIFIFEENMDSTLFIKILRDTIIPEGKKLYGNKWDLLMDNDPKHKAKKVMTFLHENQVSCPKIPTRSPDLNPLENVWSMLDNELKQLRHSTKASLRKAIHSAWKKIDQ